MRFIESSTLNNQNISAALLTHTYTADADRGLFVRLFADQIAGSGDYIAYVTIQRLGAGSFYQVVPITTATVGAVTSVAFTTIEFSARSTDVVRVYIDGLAGDVATPDIITEIWESGAVLNTVWTDAKAAFVDVAVSTRSTYAGGAVDSVTNNVGGNVVGSVGSVVGAVGSVAGAVTVGTNNDKTDYALSAAGIDAILDEVVEGALTLRQCQRLLIAAAMNKASGGGTNQVTYRDLADALDRIVMTVDVLGNRSAIVLNGA